MSSDDENIVAAERVLNFLTFNEDTEECGFRLPTLNEFEDSIREDHPLVVAAEEGDLEAVMRLYDEESRDDALSFAARKGHLKVVVYLASRGAETSVLESDAVNFAASHGHLSVTKYLYERNTEDAWWYDDNMLSIAAELGHPNVVMWLLNTRKDLTRIDTTFSTALERNHQSIYTLLYDMCKGLPSSHIHIQRLEQDRDSIRHSLLPSSSSLFSLVAEYY